MVVATTKKDAGVEAETPEDKSDDASAEETPVDDSEDVEGEGAEGGDEPTDADDADEQTTRRR